MEETAPRRSCLRTSQFCVLAAVFCLALPGVAAAGGGDPDPAFGGDGSVSFDVDGTSGSPIGGAVAAIPQTDGGMLLVGAVNTAIDGDGNPVQRLAFVRLTGAGERDPGYGTDGVVLLPAASGTVAVDAVELAGGDIAVLSGGVLDADGQFGYALSRVNPDGTLDTSFSGDGVVVTGFGAFRAPARSKYEAMGRALTLVGSDRLVVGAGVRETNDSFDFFAYYAAGVAAYDIATGELDPTYGQAGTAYAGTALLEAPTGYRSFSAVQDIAAEPVGGRVLVLDELYDTTEGISYGGVYRLDDDGTPDATFGDADTTDPSDDGVSVVRFRPELQNVTQDAHAVIALPEGGVAVAGGVGAYDAARREAAVARLTDTGDPDGVVFVDGGTDGWRTFEALELIDSELYAAGRSIEDDAEGNQGQREAWLVKIDGSDPASFALDTSFGEGGLARSAPMDLGWVRDLAGTPDGFAVISGASESDQGFAAARFDAQASRQPVNTALPTTQPEDYFAAIGDTRTAQDGSWRYGDVVTRSWQRCGTSQPAGSPAGAADCVDIAEQTGTTYVTTAADAGKHVRVVETNTNGSFASTAASATFEVKPNPPRFESDPVVVPSGSVPAGTTVRAAWTASGSPEIVASVSWYHCPTATGGPCDPVSGDATGDDSYLTTTSDIGKYMRAVVALTGPGGYNSKETTNATGVSAVTTELAPVATGAPTITPADSVVEGATLTRSGDGTWNQDGLTFSYRWERCNGSGDACSTISGAGSASYVTTAADAAGRLRLVVDARRGEGPVGSAYSASTPVTAKPVPPVIDPVDPVHPVDPDGSVTIDTATTEKMPDVRGLKIDAAKQRIENAGIYAKIDAREVIRKQPKKLDGKTLDIGDVSGQSLAGGTRVKSSIGDPKALRLVTEAGPKATKATGGPFGPVCTGPAIREDLKGVGLGEVFEILKSKRCRKLEVDFTVSSRAKQLEVRRASKDGDRELKLLVVVPGNPANLDLTPIFRQGAFNNRPSFGRDDWALTAGATNIFGVQVVNRANVTIEDAEILVDGSKVGADDIHGDRGGEISAHGFSPKKAGIVNVLVQQEDARGNKIFGFGRFRVIERRGDFTAIDGRRYTKGGDPATGGATSAGLMEFFQAIGDFARSLGVGHLYIYPVTNTAITKAAKQNVGAVQISLGDVLGPNAGVIAPGGGNVVASGGGNAITVGNGEVINADDGNKISLAKAEAVASGGGNLIGEKSIPNGTGSLIEIREDAVASGGGNIIGTASGNIIGTASGNVIAAGGGNVIAVSELISDNGLG